VKTKGTGSALVDEIIALMRRFLVMSDEQYLVVALWIIHTYCMEAFEQTPYLAVTSPEKQCGKTRLLELLSKLCNRAWLVITPSEATIFRKINNEHPTLLLDEVDTIFNPKAMAAGHHEHLRALFNAGHRRGVPVARAADFGAKLVEFDVFCPKVLSGIGALPDTIADRSIPIRMQRRTANEPLEPFKQRYIEGPCQVMVDKIIEKSLQITGPMSNGKYPDMPDELSDRLSEGCEPLVHIADFLGCGEPARKAVVTLCAVEERVDEHSTMRLRLLRDLKKVFTGAGGKPRPRLSTTKVIELLEKLEDSQWKYPHYYGRDITSRDLATMLRHYGVEPKLIRLSGSGRKGTGEVKRGYLYDDLHSVFERYLSAGEQG
jgi:hypothetical protein